MKSKTARKPAKRIETQKKDAAKEVAVGGRLKSLRSELQAVHGWIVFGLGLLQPCLLKWLGPSLGAEADILKKPWNEFYFAVLTQTAPLTISLTLLFVLGIAYFVSEEPGYGGLMFLLGGGTLLMLVAGKVSTWFGYAPVPHGEYVNLSFPFGPFLNTLLSYWTAYGSVLFVSSMAISGYGAYACFAHGWPLWRLLQRHWQTQATDA
jgi:hypothetical protein